MYVLDEYLISDIKEDEIEEDIKIKNRSITAIKENNTNVMFLNTYKSCIYKIHNKIFNLKDTHSGNINIQPYFSDENIIKFKFNRIFDLLTKIRVVYENIKQQFSSVYELVLIDNKILHTDNKYIE